jgi:hypothetical protein
VDARKKMDAVRPHQGLICKHGRYGSHPTLIFSEYPFIYMCFFWTFEYLKRTSYDKVAPILVNTAWSRFRKQNMD